MRIIVTDTLGDLQRDLERLPAKASKDVRAAVRHASMTGNLIAKENARAKSGPHGRDYYKRLKWDEPEPTGGIGWASEFGPVGIPKTNFVGAGWRHGENTDLDLAAPQAIGLVAQDLRKAMDGWFW